MALPQAESGRRVVSAWPAELAQPGWAPPRHHPAQRRPADTSTARPLRRCLQRVCGRGRLRLGAPSPGSTAAAPAALAAPAAAPAAPAPAAATEAARRSCRGRRHACACACVAAWKAPAQACCHHLNHLLQTPGEKGRWLGVSLHQQHAPSLAAMRARLHIGMSVNCACLRPCFPGPITHRMRRAGPLPPHPTECCLAAPPPLVPPPPRAAAAGRAAGAWGQRALQLRAVQAPPASSEARAAAAARVRLACGACAAARRPPDRAAGLGPAGRAAAAGRGACRSRACSWPPRLRGETGTHASFVILAGTPPRLAPSLRPALPPLPPCHRATAPRCDTHLWSRLPRRPLPPAWPPCQPWQGRRGAAPPPAAGRSRGSCRGGRVSERSTVSGRPPGGEQRRTMLAC